MKKQVFGRQFKRDVNERKAMFKNLLTSLVLEERIKTTIAKAKAIKSAADKLITKAKKEGNSAYKALHPDVNQDAVVKLITDIGPRFATRQGGYTRIIKLGKRRVADNAPMAIIEWTEQSTKLKAQPVKKTKKSTKVTTSKAKLSEVKAELTNKELEKSEIGKPVIGKKEEKMQKPGIFKRLVTRQKKGQ